MANKICGNRVGRGFDKEKKKWQMGKQGGGEKLFQKLNS